MRQVEEEKIKEFTRSIGLVDDLRLIYAKVMKPYFAAHTGSHKEFIEKYIVFTQAKTQKKVDFEFSKH